MVVRVKNQQQSGTDTLVKIEGTCTTELRKKEKDKITRLGDWWAPETIALVKALKKQTLKSACSAFCKSYQDAVEGQQKWEESIKADLQHEPRVISKEKEWFLVISLRIQCCSSAACFAEVAQISSTLVYFYIHLN